MMNEDLAQRYRRIPVGVLNDVLVKAGKPHQVLSSDIRGFDGLPPFAGPAFCVRGERRMGSGPADLRFEIYRQFRTASVLVIASGAYRPTAVLGENMTTALQQRGCAGVVVDGGYRDRQGIAEMGIPVRAMFVTPVASAGNFAFVEIDARVVLPGQSSSTVAIGPGDMIVGDEDGVIVVPAQGVQTILEDAEKVIEAESRTRDLILAGQDAEQAYKANDRFSHVRPI
jgi:regulator of RNase E activity RraA